MARQRQYVRRRASKPSRPYVPLRDGVYITEKVLPQFGTWWSRRAKRDVVLAVLGGILSEEAARRKYRMSREEYQSWVQQYKKHGIKGLNLTTSRMHRTSRLLASNQSLPGPEFWPEGTLVTAGSVQLLFRPFGAQSIVAVNKNVVPLKMLEVFVLELIFRRAGTVVTHEMLLEFLYPTARFEAQLSIVKVLVRSIRRRLEDADLRFRGSEFLKSEHGRGFYITGPTYSRKVLS